MGTMGFLPCKPSRMIVTLKGSKSASVVLVLIIKMVIAEHSIQTVVGWTRAMLLQAAVYWPAAADLQLWPFSLEHAVYLWNILPDPITKITLWN